MTKLYEADLYEPIQKHFSKQGYRVNGEVIDCDLTAVKDEELIIVELKLNLNIDLLLQATRRQRLTDLVYIAIPKPKRISRKRWNDITQLVRRLELGLIIVSLAGNRKKIEFKVHPEPYKRMTSKNTRKKAALIKEIEGRSADYNIGGSNKTKIMTAYKENCIQIACYLEKLGQMSPKALVALGTGDKTPLILQKNYYKWFERMERGIYVITEQGKADLEEYPELVEYYLGGLKTEE
ncbi:hypothetical protein J7I80_18350 [Bacillus sp. ISL-41]|uniref:DUF2161 domain-containing phosphodiesterase n=1 Tax=Bacillus sp. ISL-41 TaxID=2819127 RepID=UPI001BE6C285|nr:DUF2161 family putative PD-(D/E)XK-type phosphodiesterase [Bacillus sp. ISL-41]MBT2644210.1 hypothetical protein [Bacillus sp. ISL-41]